MADERLAEVQMSSMRVSREQTKATLNLAAFDTSIVADERAKRHFVNHEHFQNWTIVQGQKEKIRVINEKESRDGQDSSELGKKIQFEDTCVTLRQELDFCNFEVEILDFWQKEVDLSTPNQDDSSKLHNQFFGFVTDDFKIKEKVSKSASSSESDLKIVGSPYAWVVGFHESRDRISLFHDALETNGKLKKQRVRPWGATSAIDGIYKQWQVGDIVHCHYDQDKGEIWFGLNGDWYFHKGLAFSSIPKGIDGVGIDLHPAVSFQNGVIKLRTIRSEEFYGTEVGKALKDAKLKYKKRIFTVKLLHDKDLALANFKNSVERVLIESVSKHKDSREDRPTHFKDECKRLLESFRTSIEMEIGEQIITKCTQNYEQYFDICPLVCGRLHFMEMTKGRPFKSTFVRYPTDQFTCRQCGKIKSSEKNFFFHCTKCEFDICLDCTKSFQGEESKLEKFEDHATLLSLECIEEHPGDQEERLKSFKSKTDKLAAQYGIDAAKAKKVFDEIESVLEQYYPPQIGPMYPGMFIDDAPSFGMGNPECSQKHMMSVLGKRTDVWCCKNHKECKLGVGVAGKHTDLMFSCRHYLCQNANEYLCAVCAYDSVKDWENSVLPKASKIIQEESVDSDVKSDSDSNSDKQDASSQVLSLANLKNREGDGLFSEGDMISEGFDLFKEENTVYQTQEWKHGLSDGRGPSNSMMEVIRTNTVESADVHKDSTQSKEAGDRKAVEDDKIEADDLKDKEIPERDVERDGVMGKWILTLNGVERYLLLAHKPGETSFVGIKTAKDFQVDTTEKIFISGDRNENTVTMKIGSYSESDNTEQYFLSLGGLLYSGGRKLKPLSAVDLANNGASLPNLDWKMEYVESEQSSSAMLKEFKNQLAYLYGKRGHVENHWGLSIELDEEAIFGEGPECRVSDVDPMKAAWNEKIRPGMIIRSYNDERVTRENFKQLKSILENKDMNETLKLELYQPFLAGQYRFYNSNPDQKMTKPVTYLHDPHSAIIDRVHDKEQVHLLKTKTWKSDETHYQNVDTKTFWGRYLQPRHYLQGLVGTVRKCPYFICKTYRIVEDTALKRELQANKNQRVLHGMPKGVYVNVVEIKEVPSNVKMDGHGIDWDEISRDDIEVWGRLDTDVYILMRKHRDIYVELVPGGPRRLDEEPKFPKVTIKFQDQTKQKWGVDLDNFYTGTKKIATDITEMVVEEVYENGQFQKNWNLIGWRITRVEKLTENILEKLDCVEENFDKLYEIIKDGKECTMHFEFDYRPYLATSGPNEKKKVELKKDTLTYVAFQRSFLTFDKDREKFAYISQFPNESMRLEHLGLLEKGLRLGSKVVSLEILKEIAGAPGKEKQSDVEEYEDRSMLDISPEEVLKAILYSDPKSVTLEPLAPVKNQEELVLTCIAEEGKKSDDEVANAYLYLTHNLKSKKMGVIPYMQKLEYEWKVYEEEGSWYKLNNRNQSYEGWVYEPNTNDPQVFVEGTARGWINVHDYHSNISSLNSGKVMELKEKSYYQLKTLDGKAVASGGAPRLGTVFLSLDDNRPIRYLNRGDKVNIRAFKAVYDLPEEPSRCFAAGIYKLLSPDNDVYMAESTMEKKKTTKNAGERIRVRHVVEKPAGQIRGELADGGFITYASFNISNFVNSRN